VCCFLDGGGDLDAPVFGGCERGGFFVLWVCVWEVFCVEGLAFCVFYYGAEPVCV